MSEFATKTLRRVLPLACVATLLYFGATRFFTLPFLADDYIYLWYSNVPGYALAEYVWLAKRPLTGLIDYFSFGSHVFEHSQLPFVAYYLLHCTGLLCIVLWIYSHFGPGGRGPSSRPAWWTAGLIALAYPCFHEILYMVTAVPYSLGLFFLGVGLWQGKAWVRTLFFLASFCCLETYVLPAFFLVSLDLIRAPKEVEDREGEGEASRGRLLQRSACLVPWALGCVGYAVIYKSLGEATYINLNLSLGGLIRQLPLVMKLLWTIHFYKEQWIATAIEIGIYVFLSIRLGTARVLPGWVLFAAPVVYLLASFQALLLTYYAPRALHGAVALKLAFLTFLLIRYLETVDFPTSRRGLLKGSVVATLLGTAYLGQLAFVFHLKAHNARVLEERRQEWSARMAACQEPCRLPVGNIGRGLKRDYVLPPYAIEPFLRWIQAKSVPDKKIDFDFGRR